jgi:hypothetical protein
MYGATRQDTRSNRLSWSTVDAVRTVNRQFFAGIRRDLQKDSPKDTPSTAFGSGSGPIDGVGQGSRALPLQR